MSKKIVVYSMEGCPHCDNFKKILKENKIKFVNRDIHKHEEEYNLFVEITQNDFVPAFMIVETTDETAKLFAPDRDFQDINEAFEIIKKQIIL
jgi:glutaredoxin